MHDGDSDRRSRRRGGKREFGGPEDFGSDFSGGDFGGGYGGGRDGGYGNGRDGGYGGGNREGGGDRFGANRSGGYGGASREGSGDRFGANREGGGDRFGANRSGGYGGASREGGGDRFGANRSSGEGSRPHSQDSDAPAERGPRQDGTVKFFKSDKGFGFVTPDSGEADVFVHISAVERSGLTTLDSGQRVSFETEPDRRGKGPKAVDLKELPEGGTPAASTS